MLSCIGAGLQLDRQSRWRSTGKLRPTWPQWIQLSILRKGSADRATACVGLSAWTVCLPKSAYRSVFTECFYWMLFTKLTENCSVNRAPSVHRARNDAPVQLRWRASRSLLEQLSMHRPSGTRVQNVYVLTSVTQDVENDSISRFEIGQTVQGVSASTDQRLRSCLSSDEHLPRGRSLRWVPVLDACAGCAPGRSPPRRSWSVTKRGERAFTWLLLIAYYRFIYLIGQHFN